MSSIVSNKELRASPAALNVSDHELRFCAMFGVGGIGAGSFFLLDGNQTLGREESRGGRYLDRRDYCKLHIISHYVKALMGTGFAVTPIGKVGSDDVGRRLLNEMTVAGLDLRFITVSQDAPTLFSFCYIYPDGAGGNMTTNDSACSQVSPAVVRLADSAMAAYAGRGIALAVPEAPLGAREELLRLASAHRFFRAAAFTSREMRQIIQGDLLQSVDLLAINLDEAAAAAGITAESRSAEAVVHAAIERLNLINPAMLVSLTGGSHGSWCWDGRRLTHQPVFPAKVESTAGAGDAHVSGILAGLAAGLDLASAQELAGLIAALSVTSPHTIHDGIDRHSLRTFADKAGVALSAPVSQLLEGERL